METDLLLEEVFKRFDHAGFVGQREVGEDDLQERLEMKGQERVVQGLATSLAIRCERSLDERRTRELY